MQHTQLQRLRYRYDLQAEAHLLLRRTGGRQGAGGRRRERGARAQPGGGHAHVRREGVPAPQPQGHCALGGQRLLRYREERLAALQKACMWLLVRPS